MTSSKQSPVNPVSDATPASPAPYPPQESLTTSEGKGVEGKGVRKLIGRTLLVEPFCTSSNTNKVPDTFSLLIGI